MLEVEDGIARRWILVVIRRRVDEAAPRRIGTLGEVVVLPQLAVGYVLELIKVLVLGGYFQGKSGKTGTLGADQNRYES